MAKPPGGAAEVGSGCSGPVLLPALPRHQLGDRRRGHGGVDGEVVLQHAVDARLAVARDGGDFRNGAAGLGEHGHRGVAEVHEPGRRHVDVGLARLGGRRVRDESAARTLPAVGDR